jgi:hypothetical protein
VGSLAYCAAEVEAASDRWQRALSLGGAEERDAAAFLQTYAEALERAPGLGRASLPIAGAIAAALRQRVSEEPSSRGLEEWLRERESELLEALRLDMGGPALAAIETEVDDDLSPYSSRMPPKVLAQIRAQSVARRILEVHGLGRLSLFHL